MMSNNRSAISSQRAALEAASKEEESPQPSHSPQNTNRGKYDQKLGDDMQSKMDIDDDKNDAKDMKKMKMEDSDDHKDSKWIDAGKIKKEKGEDGQQLDMNTNVIKREVWEDYKDTKPKLETDDVMKKIKEEAMSPASSSQALVKPELKLEAMQPVANTTDKKKKCSKFISILFSSKNNLLTLFNSFFLISI